jgi:hypothetical protein
VLARPDKPSHDDRGMAMGYLVGVTMILIDLQVNLNVAV